MSLRIRSHGRPASPSAYQGTPGYGGWDLRVEAARLWELHDGPGPWCKDPALGSPELAQAFPPLFRDQFSFSWCGLSPLRFKEDRVAHASIRWMGGWAASRRCDRSP